MRSGSLLRATGGSEGIAAADCVDALGAEPDAASNLESITAGSCLDGFNMEPGSLFEAAREVATTGPATCVVVLASEPCLFTGNGREDTERPRPPVFVKRSPEAAACPVS